MVLMVVYFNALPRFPRRPPEHARLFEEANAGIHAGKKDN
jgi:hypothetical protein